MSGSRSPVIHSANTPGPSRPFVAPSSQGPPPRMGDPHRRVVSQGGVPSQENAGFQAPQRQFSGPGGQRQYTARGGGSSGGSGQGSRRGSGQVSGQRDIVQGNGQENPATRGTESPMRARGRGGRGDGGRGQGNDYSQRW
ncbi:hypothetical protein WAI453_005605 [Rhynchosporium graminicola]